MSDDLKPCPFCGGTTIDDVEFDGDVPICDTCGAEGPAWPRDGDARALWNKRPGEEALHAEIRLLSGARVGEDGRTRAAGPCDHYRPCDAPGACWCGWWAADHHEASMSDDVIGCGDSGCVFGRGTGTRYGGQHTNGGCRCLEDDRTGRQFSFETKKRLRDWIRALRKQRDEARAEAVMLREARNAWVIHSEAERRKSEAEILRLQRAHAEWQRAALSAEDARREVEAERDEARAEVERLHEGGS